mmetsp:Transcript_22626/g.65137  ORF Transcript_22626/g.65137 Transcript_22626/m.65137 type:complete len:206 (-) Transcript_22626:18-635(-)
MAKGATGTEAALIASHGSETFGLVLVEDWVGMVFLVAAVMAQGTGEGRDARTGVDNDRLALWRGAHPQINVVSSETLEHAQYFRPTTGLGGWFGQPTARVSIRGDLVIVGTGGILRILLISQKTSFPPAPVQHRPMREERKGHEAIGLSMRCGRLCVARCVYADRRGGFSQRSTTDRRTSFLLSRGGFREEKHRGCGKASGRFHG